MDGSPNPPFDAWPLQRRDPAFGYAWFIPPEAVVTQVTTVHATVEMANALHDCLDAICAAHARTIEARGGLKLLADWRALASHTVEARQVYARRLQQRPVRSFRHTIIVLNRASALLRLAIQAVNLVEMVTQNRRLELSNDLAGSMRRLEIQPPQRLRTST